MATYAATQRTLQATAATLRWQPIDGDGARMTPAGTVTVDVARSDGTTLASALSTTGSAEGERTSTLSASLTADLDRLTATWKIDGVAVATTTVDIVGGFLATLAELQTRLPSSTDRYTRSELLAARDAVEDEFEEACGFAFVPRFRVVELESEADEELMLPDMYLRRVRWAQYRYEYATTWTSFSEAQCTSIPPSPAGVACLPTWWPDDAQVRIGYECGWDAAPADVTRAALIRLEDVLSQARSGAVPLRSTQTSIDGATINLAVPGWGQNLTGIPDVDVVLKRYDRRVPGIA